MRDINTDNQRHHFMSRLITGSEHRHESCIKSVRVAALTELAVVSARQM